MSEHESPFRLVDRGDALQLAGDVDYFGVDRLRRALALAADGADGPLVLDCSELDFIDHHGVLAIAEHARRRPDTLTVRGIPHAMQRACELVGVDL